MMSWRHRKRCAFSLIPVLISKIVSGEIQHKVRSLVINQRLVTKLSFSFQEMVQEEVEFYHLKVKRRCPWLNRYWKPL